MQQKELLWQRWQGASYLHRLVGLFYPWREASWLLQWAEPLGVLLVGVLVALAPFVSTSLIGVLLLAGAGYWLLLTLSDKAWVGATPIHLLVLLYWGIATIAVAFSPVKAEAFTGWLKLTLYLVWFALSARVLRTPRLRNWAIAVYLLVALIVSIYGIRQEIFGAEQLATWNDPSSELATDTRVYSYLGNPNLLAGYLLGAIAFSLAAVFAWPTLAQKALALTMVGANLACIYFTDSRGGWLGLLALLLSFALLLYVWWRQYLPRFWQVWLLPLCLGVGAALLVIAIATVEPLRLRVGSIFAGREDSSNNYRINVWLGAIEMIRDRPLLGIGPGNEAFNQIYPLYQRPNYSALSAYSVMLEVAVETGIVGLMAFLALLTGIFQQGWVQLQQLRRSNDRQGFWLIAAIASCVGWLVHGLVDTVWYRPQVNTLWWLVVALIASFYSLHRTERQPD